MSGPIIQDSLFVTLNASNNWTYTNTLAIPIVNMNLFRALCNHNYLAQVNFARPALIISPDNANGSIPTPTIQNGLIFIGDDTTWFETSNKNITFVTVSLYPSGAPILSTDSFDILFQFINKP